MFPAFVNLSTLEWCMRSTAYDISINFGVFKTITCVFPPTKTKVRRSIGQSVVRGTGCKNNLSTISTIKESIADQPSKARADQPAHALCLFRCLLWLPKTFLHFIFDKSNTDRSTNGSTSWPTNRRTDAPNYRDARTRIKHTVPHPSWIEHPFNYTIMQEMFFCNPVVVICYALSW